MSGCGCHSPHRTRPALVLAVVLLALCAGEPARAGSVLVPGATMGEIRVPVVSMKALAFRGTVQQRFDFSCGSAAVATLLTYHYEDPVPEAEIFMAMYRAGDQAKIRREGFSLLDMKNYLVQRGYQADGYRITLDKLREIGVPAIVLVSNHGYKHFTVVKGVTGREVFLGDPALGRKVQSRTEFEHSWNGLVFIVRSKKDVAQRHFNQPAEWPARGRLANIVPLTGDRLINPTLYLPTYGR
jgi:uncharacterized protein